ncbi:unnamed protein product [Knipowitschia caucasica]
MARSFPGLFRKEARGKKRFTQHHRKPKSFSVNFVFLDRKQSKTPKGEYELRLLLAGLGKRSLLVDEMMTHSQLSEMLWKAYPKLELVRRLVAT